MISLADFSINAISDQLLGGTGLLVPEGKRTRTSSALTFFTLMQFVGVIDRAEFRR